MIIEASRVNMSSNRQYVYYEQKESISMSEKAGQAVQLDLSKEAKSLSEQMIEYQKEQKEKQQQQQQQNLQDLLKNQKAHEVDYAAVPESQEDWKVKMLRNLLYRHLRISQKLADILYYKLVYPDIGCLSAHIFACGGEIFWSDVKLFGIPCHHPWLDLCP